VIFRIICRLFASVALAVIGRWLIGIDDANRAATVLCLLSGSVGMLLIGISFQLSWRALATAAVAGLRSHR
jgi:hypothetical protein